MRMPCKHILAAVRLHCNTNICCGEREKEESLVRIKRSFGCSETDRVYSQWTSQTHSQRVNERIARGDEARVS